MRVVVRFGYCSICGLRIVIVLWLFEVVGVGCAWFVGL